MALSPATPVAVTISAPTFHRLVAGTFDAPAVPVGTFTIEASAVATLKLKRQMFEVAQVIFDRQIAPTDAAALPETSLAGGFDELRDRIVAALDPSVTMVRMVNHRISALTAAQAEQFDDIMAAPDLSEPTYQALAEISHDWLLPGIDTLPADTTTLVESNRTFISAFLVGMNHEVARELLWREYPTDQRGTYCRQFWAHRGTGNPTDRYDLDHLLHASPGLTLEQLGESPGDVAAPLRARTCARARHPATPPRRAAARSRPGAEDRRRPAGRRAVVLRGKNVCNRPFEQRRPRRGASGQVAS